VNDGDRKREQATRDEERAPERRGDPPAEGWPADADQPTLDNESAGEEATETPGMGS